MPADNVYEVQSGCQAMKRHSNMPAGGKPTHAEGNKNTKEERHFYHTPYVVDLKAHCFGIGIGILEAGGRTLGERVLEITDYNLCRVTMRHTREKNAPDMNEGQNG